MRELVACQTREYCEAIIEVSKPAYPDATFEIRQHVGRPGFSLYGKANWTASLMSHGDDALEQFCTGAYAALRSVK